MHVDDGGIEEQVLGGSEREAGVQSLRAAASIGVPALQEVDRQPWRTEPEIEPARQEQLSRCLTTLPELLGKQAVT